MASYYRQKQRFWTKTQSFVLLHLTSQLRVLSVDICNDFGLIKTKITALLGSVKSLTIHTVSLHITALDRRTEIPCTSVLTRDMRLLTENVIKIVTFSVLAHVSTFYPYARLFFVSFFHLGACSFTGYSTEILDLLR